MIKQSGAMLCAVAFSVSAASVAFNSPAQWGTLRSNSISTSFVVDSTLVGKPILLIITENVTGVEKTIATKSVVLKDQSNEVVIPVSTDVIGGAGYLSLKWKVGSQDGIVAPFAIAPISNMIDPSSPKAVTLNGDPTAAGIKSSGAVPLKVNQSDVLFGWNPGALAFVVRGSGVVEISLDIDNSKSSFLSFSDRKIVVDFDSSRVSYFFSSRKAKQNEIVYTNEIWTGDMKGSVKDGECMVTLPWYDLGAKPFSGRQLGLFVRQGDSMFPVAGQETTPATWGNILLK